MTYATTQRRSESDMPATESERPAKRFEKPAKRFECGRPVRLSRRHSEGLRGQLKN